MKYLSFLLITLSPTAPAADGAIGLGVLERGISLWHVRAEAGTMWGIELERLRGIYERIEFDTYSRETEENQLSARVSLTRKKLTTVSKKVSWFGYQSVFFDGNERRWGDRRELGVGNLSLGLGFGLGVLWHPINRIGIALRQGLELDFGYESQELRDRDDPQNIAINEIRRLRVQMSSPRLLVLVGF